MPALMMRPREAADYLSLSQSTLSKMRLRGDGPVYAKAGPRIVVYHRADLDSWIKSRRRRSTSEEIVAHSHTDQGSSGV